MDAVIRLEGVSVHFAQRGGVAARLAGRRGPVRAVENVDLEVRRGEILGIIGESGSGKTTLARTVIGMQRPTSGRILLDGDDIARMRPSALRRLRKRLQMVFQDPHAALNPTMTIGQALDHPVRIHFPGLSVQ
jgi:peptide/nickel transport system ATP-binding protein